MNSIESIIVADDTNKVVIPAAVDMSVISPKVYGIFSIAAVDSPPVIALDCYRIHTVAAVDPVTAIVFL